MLGTKYKGGPVYFNWVWVDTDTNPKKRDAADEYEERIYSDDPYLQNLDKYIKNIDILIDDDRTIPTLKEMKEIKSPLLNKIRIFKNEKDLSYGKNWVSIHDYKLPEGDTISEKEDKYFNFDLLKNIITVLLVGDKNINNKEYIKKFFLKYINKFIDLGVDKLKDEINDTRLNAIVYYVQRNIEWINPNDINDSFIGSIKNEIQGISMSIFKNELQYEAIKLLSDEMAKYKVLTIEDLIRVKKGEKKVDIGTTEDSIRNYFKKKQRLKENPDAKPEIKKEKIVDYSNVYGYVYKQYDRYVLVDNNQENHFLRWTNLKESVRNKILDLGNVITTKNIINGIFNSYDESKSKELIFSISTDVEYKLIDLRGKMIYKEITEKDYLGDDIGNRSCWNYIDYGDWVLFIQKNMTEKEFLKILSKLTKLTEDKEVKIRFIWTITEKLMGEEKTNKFFEENNLIPREGSRGEKEVKYLINIGEKKKQPEYAD